MYKVRLALLTDFRESLVRSLQRLLSELTETQVNDHWRSAMNAWVRTLVVGWDLGRS